MFFMGSSGPPPADHLPQRGVESADFDFLSHEGEGHALNIGKLLIDKEAAHDRYEASWRGRTVKSLKAAPGKVRAALKNHSKGLFFGALIALGLVLLALGVTGGLMHSGHLPTPAHGFHQVANWSAEKLVCIGALGAVISLSSGLIYAYAKGWSPKDRGRERRAEEEREEARNAYTECTEKKKEEVLSAHVERGLEELRALWRQGQEAEPPQ